MNDNSLASIGDGFGNLTDKRVQGRCTYPLVEIITIAMGAVVTGANSWVEVETFGKGKEDRHDAAMIKELVKLPSTWLTPGPVPTGSRWDREKWMTNPMKSQLYRNGCAY